MKVINKIKQGLEVVGEKIGGAVRFGVGVVTGGAALAVGTSEAQAQAGAVASELISGVDDTIVQGNLVAIAALGIFLAIITVVIIKRFVQAGR